MACEKTHYEAGVYLNIKSVLRELGIKVIKSNWIYFYSITITINKDCILDMVTCNRETYHYTQTCPPWGTAKNSSLKGNQTRRKGSQFTNLESIKQAEN